LALYSRVADKEELLDEMLEALLDEIELPDPGLHWAERLRMLAHSARAAGHRHPAVFPLLLQRPAITPAAHRPTEVILDALTAAGLDDAQTLRYEQLLSTWLLGFVCSEVSGRFDVGTTPTNRRLAALPKAEFPQHKRLRAGLLRRNWDTEFAASLAALLNEIGNAAPANAAAPATVGSKRR
jgi:hypothetical protein